MSQLNVQTKHCSARFARSIEALMDNLKILYEIRESEAAF